MKKKLFLIMILLIFILSNTTVNSYSIKNKNNLQNDLIKNDKIDPIKIKVGSIKIRGPANPTVECNCVEDLDDLYVMYEQDVPIILYISYDVNAAGISDGSWLYFRVEGQEIEKGIDGKQKGKIEKEIMINAGTDVDIELYAYYHDTLIKTAEDTDNTFFSTIPKDTDIWIEEIKIMPEGEIPLHHDNSYSSTIHGDSFFYVSCTWYYILPYGEESYPSSTKFGIRCEGPDRWCSWTSDRDDDYRLKTIKNFKPLGIGIKKTTDFSYGSTCFRVDGGFGEHRIDVKLDIDGTPNGKFDEENEGNNEMSYSFLPKYRPMIPDKPEGKKRCKYGETYTYTASTWDFDSDELWYQFIWDDDTKTEWLGPCTDNETVYADKLWNDRSDYCFFVKVKVKDSDGYKAESDILVVKCYQTKQKYQKIFELFPFLNIKYNFLQKIIK